MLARTRCASTRRTKTACALRSRAIVLLEQGPSVSAITTSACTATGNHPGPWEIPKLMRDTSTPIVTETSAVLQEGPDRLRDFPPPSSVYEAQKLAPADQSNAIPSV